MAYDREVSLGFFRILVTVTDLDFFFHVKMSLYYLYREDVSLTFFRTARIIRTPGYYAMSPYLLFIKNLWH